MTPQLVLIAAVARNGVIGSQGLLPWHLPQDLQHFREVTLGHPVLMGRSTWQSLPARFRPLPGRRNLVLSRQPGWQAEGATVLSTLQDAVDAAAGSARLFVIGGAAVYAAALPLADELVLTEIDRDFDGDVRFPDFDRHRWAEVARTLHPVAPPNDFSYSFATYRRRA